MERNITPGWVAEYLRKLPNTVVTKDSQGDHLLLELAPSGSFNFRVLPHAYLSTGQAQYLSETLEFRSPLSNSIPLLAVRRLTKDARESLADQGISWIEEATGIVSLRGPGLYVDTRVDVQHQEENEKTRRTRLRGLTGRCAETLLLLGQQSKILTTTVLANEARVSAAMATYVLQRLECEEIVIAHGTGRRNRTWEIKNLALLLDLWKAEESLARARITHSYVWASTPKDLLYCMTNLNRSVSPWAIGGSAAANIYTPTVTVEPVLKVWIFEQESVDEVLEKVNGKKVMGGHNVEFYQLRENPWALHAESMIERPAESSVKKTWTVTDHTTSDPTALHLVSRPRAYVETCYNGTGRDIEIAESLRRDMKLDYL